MGGSIQDTNKLGAQAATYKVFVPIRFAVAGTAATSLASGIKRVDKMNTTPPQTDQLPRKKREIKIGRIANVASCEDYLKTVHDTPGADLVLPSNIHFTQCGGAAALLQVVVSWARKNESERPRIRSYATPEYEHDTLTRLVDTLPGLAGVLMASDVVALDGARSVLKTCYALAKKRVEAMDGRELAKTAKGAGISLVCADETTKAALRPFYNQSDNSNAQLRGEQEFIELAHDLLASTHPDVRQSLTDDDAESIGVMLRELFSNTHFHAIGDASGRRYRKSIRGLHASYFNMDTTLAEKIAGNFKPAESYFYRLSKTLPAREKFRIFELSIFDSGPGLAAKIARQEIPTEESIQTEYELVTKCFMRNVSTRNAPGGGIGLARMMQRLKATKGFLRLRTGRLSLYQEFSAATTADLLNIDCKLRDASDENKNLTALPHASGTLVTLLIPVHAK